MIRNTKASPARTGLTATATDRVVGRLFRRCITCGAFTPEGDFLELPQFDVDRLLDVWQDAVFELYLAKEKIEPEVVENMRGWEHNGFSVDQSVLLPAGDQAGIERLVQYMTRCPFSLSRLVKVLSLIHI